MTLGLVTTWLLLASAQEPPCMEEGAEGPEGGELVDPKDLDQECWQEASGLAEECAALGLALQKCCEVGKTAYYSCLNLRSEFGSMIGRMKINKEGELYYIVVHV
jgi:hypothetical protein